MNATKEAEKWDARKHPICPPHDGTRGMKFRRFLGWLLDAAYDASAAVWRERDADTPSAGDE